MRYLKQYNPVYKLAAPKINIKNPNKYPKFAIAYGKANIPVPTAVLTKVKIPILNDPSSNLPNVLENHDLF